MEQFSARKIGGELQLEGREIPASIVAWAGAGVVTVKLELQGIPYVLQQLTVPIAGAEYIRLPIQIGMLGWVMAADYYLGGMSGQGGGTADLTRRPNLSNLVWSPIGNKNWSTTDDQNKLVLYGPDGAILRTMDKNTKLDVNSGGFNFAMLAGSTFSIANLPVSPTTPGALYNSGGAVKITP